MSETNQTEFKSWARVEVMGHQTHIGFCQTQAFGGAVMFRVDQPAIEGVEETLVRPEWIGDTYAPSGTVVRRGDIQAASVLIGAASIYRIIPCDEAAAMKAIRAGFRPPLIIVKLADVPEIAAAEADSEDDYDNDEKGPF